jgi:hypothetical protein
MHTTSGISGLGTEVDGSGSTVVSLSRTESFAHPDANASTPSTTNKRREAFNVTTRLLY